MRIVEVVTPAANRDSLAGIAEHFEVLDFCCAGTWTFEPEKPSQAANARK